MYNSSNNDVQLSWLKRFSQRCCHGSGLYDGQSFSDDNVTPSGQNGSPHPVPWDSSWTGWGLYHAVYSVVCTVCYVQCTVCAVHCLLCTACFVLCTMYSVLCTVYCVCCVLCVLYYVLCAVYCVFYSIVYGVSITLAEIFFLSVEFSSRLMFHI